MINDQVEHIIDRLLANRNSLSNDLKNCSDDLSNIGQLVLMAEVAKIDVYLKELRQKLEDEGWFEFLRQSWGEDE